MVLTYAKLQILIIYEMFIWVYELYTIWKISGAGMHFENTFAMGEHI